MAHTEQLVLLSGEQKGRIIPVKGTVTIGRHPENTIQFDDLQVSRRHAKVIRRTEGVYIKDLSSGNGVYVGPLRVDDYCLTDGDIIRVGRQQIQYRVAVEVEKQPAAQGASLIMQDHESSSFEARKADKVYQTFFQKPGESVSSVELKQIQARLAAVYSANQAIASERSLEKVFDNVVAQIFSLIPAHNGLILLKQEDTGELGTEFVRSATPGTSLRVSSSIVNRCHENSEAIITHDAAQDSRFGGGVSIISENITSAMCVPLTHQGERLGVIYVDNHGESNAFADNDLELLVALAAPAATAIRNAQYLKMLEQAYQDTLIALANAIELRDHYTVGHTWRVTNFAVEIARELHWDEDKLKEVQMGGVLHDVGKIAVDNAILSKPSSLTEEEFAKMKVHPERGADLLRDIKFLHPLIPYCLFHHERWNGTGYPFGLKEDDIPIEGRLVAVADALDAMTSTRPYRKAMDPEIALGEITNGAGSQFDPSIVDALQSCYKKGRIKEVLQDYCKKEAHSIACPFCSTFIRFDERVTDGSLIQCNVCHKTISILKKGDAFFGLLSQRISENDIKATPEHKPRAEQDSNKLQQTPTSNKRTDGERREPPFRDDSGQ